MATKSFISIVVFFILSCGSVLIFSAWPSRIRQAEVTEVLSLALGAVMVFISGYGLAMILA